MTAIYDYIGSRYIPKQLDMHVITFKYLFEKNDRMK